jgi:hypothetical protein
VAEAVKKVGRYSLVMILKKRLPAVQQPINDGRNPFFRQFLLGMNSWLL